MPIVGEYDLVQKLGHGSYADVFKGIHLPTNQRFAVKAISKERIGDRRLQENLTREIAIMRDMRHINIVGLYNTFENSKYIFLVLELCRGGDLSTFIKKSVSRRLDESIAQSFLKQLADGLHFLSERNIIHRDLKPANVLLSEPSEFAILKLADFGFAKHLAEASLAHTQCGSPLYMAPEILENQEYDSKADLWSVGCIFFEMLVGTTPFRGTNQRNLLSNILSKPLDIPTDVSVGPMSVQLLRDLLKTNPGERIAMKDFHRKCSNSLHALSRPTTPGKPVDAYYGTPPMAITPTHTSIESNFSAGLTFTSQSLTQTQSMSHGKTSHSQSPGQQYHGMTMPSTSLGSGHNVPVGPPSVAVGGGNTPPQDIRKSFNSTTTTTLMSLNRNTGALVRTNSMGPGSVGTSAGTSTGSQKQIYGQSPPTQQYMITSQNSRSRSNSQDIYTTQPIIRSRSNSNEYASSVSPSPKSNSYMAQYHPMHWAQSQPGPQVPFESQLIFTDIDHIMTPMRQRSDIKTYQSRRHSGSSSSGGGGGDAKQLSTSPATPSSRFIHAASQSITSTINCDSDPCFGMASDITPLRQSREATNSVPITEPTSVARSISNTSIEARNENSGCKDDDNYGNVDDDGNDDDFVLIEKGIHPWTSALHAIDSSDRPSTLATGLKQQSAKGVLNLLSPIRETHSPIDSSLCSIDGSSGVSYRDAAIEQSIDALTNDNQLTGDNIIDELESVKKNFAEPFGYTNPSEREHIANKSDIKRDSGNNAGQSDNSSNIPSGGSSSDLSTDQALFSVVQHCHSVRESVFMLATLGDEYVTAALLHGSAVCTSTTSIIDQSISHLRNDNLLIPSSDAVAAALPDSDIFQSQYARSHMSSDSSRSTDDEKHAGKNDLKRMMHNIQIAIALYTIALKKTQVVLQSILNLTSSTDKFRSQLISSIKQELMKLFDGLLERLDGCHTTLSQIPAADSQVDMLRGRFKNNSALYEVACQLNTFINAQERAGQLQIACNRYPYLLFLLEELLQNCTSASASATEIEDELRLNKFSNAVEAQYKDCQSRLTATATTNQKRNQ